MAGGPRIAVLGAGSVGCFVGGAWAAAGLAVALIGRERLRADIGEHGLTLTDFTGWRAHLAPGEVRFMVKPDALAEADLILLCVKSNDTEKAAKQIGRHGRKGAIVVSLQNGVSNVETLRKAIGRRFEIAQGMVPFNIAWLGHGRFHKGVAGDLVVQDLPATRAFAGAVGGGPARLTLAENMEAIAWGKLLINLNNAVNALSGLPLLDQLRKRDYRRVVAAAMIEALDLLKAAGIAPAKIGPVPPSLLPHVLGAPDFLFNSLFLRAQRIDSRARSSMADDLAARRPTEIDHLNGEVVRLAERLGREAPVNAAITALVHQAELGIEHLWSPSELRAHVFEGHKVAPVFGY
jgi:2-dehydropantoate 2-reductase